jgi:hypothetical protein
MRPLLVLGAVREDDGLNFFRHFYDPTYGRGLAMNTVTKYLAPLISTDVFDTSLWARLKEQYAGAVTEALAANSKTADWLLARRCPPDLKPLERPRYPSALAWATDQHDQNFDLESAIEAYDYSPSSRATAYEALGHVIHVLQDLAQPDHASNRPHPGNSMTERVYRDRPGLYAGVANEDLVGYETFWKERASWPRRTGQQPLREQSLKAFFDRLAMESKAAEAALALPDSPRLHHALGLRDDLLPVATQVDFLTALQKANLGSDAENWCKYEMLFPVFPDIARKGSRAAMQSSYETLGHRLLPRAEEYSAGLMQFFFEVVNPPPFVDSVAIRQDNTVRYEAKWVAQTPVNGRLPSRQLVKSTDDPLGVGASAPAAEVTIRFGPTIVGGAYTSAKKVEVTAVKIRESGKTINGQMESSGYVWRGTFRPEAADLGGTLEITARDLGPHVRDRSPRGDELDSEPATPAKARGSQPYDWRNYEVGPDRNHTLTGHTFALEPCESQCLSYHLETPEGVIAVRADIELGEATDIVSTNPDSPDITFSGRISVIGRGVEASSCPFPRLDRQLPLKVRLWRHPMWPNSVMSLVFDHAAFAAIPLRCAGLPASTFSGWYPIISLMSLGPPEANAGGGLPVTRIRGQDGWIYEVSHTTDLGGQELRWRIRVREASMRRP